MTTEPQPTTTTTTTSTVPTSEVPATTSTTTPTTTTSTLAPLQTIAYELVAELAFPIHLATQPGGEVGHLATKAGMVWAFANGEVFLEKPSLDIRERVRNRGEQGLFAIAPHPEDGTRLFVHYSANDGDTVVSEFALGLDGFDPDSERVLLRLDQPASNHNGGMIQFGPDGRLYVGLGDGGGAGDQFGNGQNTDTLLGGIVALSVDGDPNPTLFAYGLRNPWRFWIDGELIYIADVGQNRFEEITVAPLEAGLNFGWPITEGLHCFRPSSGCDTTGLTLPQVEVPLGEAGDCAITGGIVYRGEAIPELAGHYFYSDFCGGYLRSFRYEAGQVVDEADWTDQVGIPGQVVSFGIDPEGEMYVLTTDAVYRVVAVRG
ncbi:MAG: PQQ-dependent sugar dehydrogenase [Acidimicrobiia bacterium]